MKKVIIPSIVVVVLIAAAAIFSALHPAPKVIIFEDELHKTEKTFNKDNVKFLDQIGFIKSNNVQNNLPALYEEKAKYFKDKYGLEFYGEKVINKTLSITGLLLGNPTQYIGKIPDLNIIELKKNLDLIGIYNEKPPKGILYNSSGSNEFVVANNFQGEPWTVYGVIADGVLSEETIKSIDHDGHKLTMEIPELNHAGYPGFSQVIRASTMYSTSGPRFTDDAFFYSVSASRKNTPEIPIVIIASAKEFQLSPDQEIENNRIKNKPVVRDPMVLLKVDGGYVKLTSWN